MKRKIMKRYLAMLVAGMLAVMSLAGCSSDSSDDTSAQEESTDTDEGQDETSAEETAEAEGSGDTDDSEGGLIGVCMQNMSSSISELESEALTELFEAQGYEVQVVDAGDSVSTQLSQIQNFILMGAKMLVVLPCEIETLEDALIEAREEGIKVVISGGTGSISEDAYDAVSADDEFVIGMWVASVTKTWVEANMDPDGDWTVQFLSSTLSEDAISRCAGEAMIIEEYLKNEDGEYVNENWQVVDESEKIENPVYCEMIAERVEAAGGLDAVSTEMDLSGDNRSVVANVLTQDPDCRVIIAYNSLASTAGSGYVMDTYSEEEAAEFAFFSGGVMGDEYEYLIGSVAEGHTDSVFRAAAQFGGGDAAATLAALADSVMNGEEGVDYGKTNPNGIGVFYAVTAEENNGNAALLSFDTPSSIASYTVDELLALDSAVYYWDSESGYNEDEAEDDEEETTDTAEEEEIDGDVYTCEMEGLSGTDVHRFVLRSDGTCEFCLPDSEMITDVYEGTYEIADDGVTVAVTGLANVDTTSSYTTPGLWDYIDSETGDTTIIIDPDTGTFSIAE